jgi:hypothetical protein
MYYIIYLSAGINWFNETELKEILEISNINNSRNNVTGLLLYDQGNFIQLLEGEENDVQQTFKKISADRRHKGITPIVSGNIEQRSFPEWAMGFKSTSSSDLNELNGYLDPANKDFLLNKDKNLAINLLKVFVKIAKIN